jgi:hypothetical protein
LRYDTRISLAVTLLIKAPQAKIKRQTALALVEQVQTENIRAALF